MNKKKENIVVSISIPKDLLDKIDVLAAQKCMSRSCYLRSLIFLDTNLARLAK